MRIEGRKMSTRKGKVVFLEEVLNEAARQAAKAIEEKNPALAGKAEIAEQIGIGAVVFGDLKNTRTLEVDFTLAEVLNFDGETGPYLQYTYARTQSLLDKAGRMPGGEEAPDFRHIGGDHAWQLLKTAALYPHSLALAAERYEPSVLARYLIDLAQAFNRFYHHERVLARQGAERNARIALTGAVASYLQQGLSLLGLQTPREI
jgi:arginyl-tRNA synthetase